MPDLTEQDKAYAAGFFDGEGCVQIYMGGDSSCTRNCMRTALSASGTDIGPLHWLQDRWSGSLRMCSSQVGLDKRGITQRRPQAVWTVFSFQAEKFAHDILPYLHVKRDQIELWLYARTLVNPRGRSTGLTMDEQEERMRVVDLCKELKRVG